LLPAARFSEQPEAEVAGKSIAIGQRENGQGWSHIPIAELTKHALVVGTTGAGKTSTSLQILLQLWNEHRVPFLVIEPAMKREYRTLIQSPIGSDVRVFTVGDEVISPLRLNPLFVPPRTHVESHINALMGLFKASFSWVPPMPEVLERAMHQVYEEHGWELDTGSHPDRDHPGAHPLLTDLLKSVERVAAASGYDAELRSNIRAGVCTRLWKLTRGTRGRMFEGARMGFVGGMMSRPAVLELANLGDDEEVAFVMGLVLLQLTAHLQAMGASDGILRHMTLIEEAHRLLGVAPAAAHSDAGNARARGVATFCNLIAEVRAFGEGLLIAEQSPSRLARDVVRNTNTKLIHRLAAFEDRDLIGRSIGLDQRQVEFIQRLGTGEAIVHRGGTNGATRVRVPDPRLQFESTDLPSDAEVALHMRTHGCSTPPASAGASEALVPDGMQMDQTGAPIKGCSPSPLCADCSESGCPHRETVLAGLTRLQASRQFAEAAGQGLAGMLRFGVEAADFIFHPLPAPPEAAACVVLQLVELSEALPPARMAIFSRNLKTAASQYP
jgi:hypothetical protein